MLKFKIKSLLIISFITLFWLSIFPDNLSAQGWTAIDFVNQEKLTGVQFLHQDTGYVISGSGNIYRTFDGGEIWDSFTIDSNIHLEDLHFINTDTGFVCGQNGAIFKTSDAGYNWTPLPKSDTSIWLFDIEMLDSKIGIAIGMQKDRESSIRGVGLRTTDGGKSWKKMKLLGAAYSEIVQDDQGTVYFLSFGKIHKSTDKGKSWTTGDTNQGQPVRTVSFFGNSAIIAGPGGTTYYSTDRGISWNPSKQSGQYVFVASQMVSQKEAYLGGINSPIMRTVDGGKTWATELGAISFTIFDYYLLGQRLYAVGSEGGIMFKDIK